MAQGLCGSRALWLKGLWLKGLWLKGLWLEGLWLKGLWLKGLWLKGFVGQGLYGSRANEDLLYIKNVSEQNLSLAAHHFSFCY